MRLQTWALDKPLADYYEQLHSQFVNSTENISDTIDRYRSIDVLLCPEKWFEALAVLEIAIEKDNDTEEVKAFFEQLFRNFDCNAAFDLDETDYDWYWNRIHAMFDQAALRFPEALQEKGMQFFSSRRGYEDKEKTLHYLQQAVGQGCESAQTILGYYYYFGFLGITDREKGMQMIEAATSEREMGRMLVYKSYIALYEGNHEEAERLLAETEKSSDPFLMRMVKEQRGFFCDIHNRPEEAARFYWEALEIAPSGFSFMRLGLLHLNQRIETADQETGIENLETALRLGRPDATRALYYFLSDSDEPCYDEMMAMYYLGKGYEYNDDYSTYQLAWLYLYDERYQDIPRGLALLDDAIALKHADAYVTKGYLYYEGRLLEKNPSEYKRLLEEADELGSASATYRLGVLYDSGELSEDGKPDYASALPYFEKAAELGEPSSCEYAGKYHLYALGTEENTEKALYFYEKGRALGSAFCIVELAIMYDDGIGVEADADKSYELLKEAEEHEYTYAHYLLGRCYRYGLGTEEDPDKAVEYFQKAVEGGNPKAMAELALCYEEGEGVEANGAKALELMKAAAEEDYAYAQYKTGYYYMYGLEGVPTDYTEAFNWLTKAAENGMPHAALALGDYFLYDFNDTEEYEKAYPYYLQAAREDLVNEGLGVCLEYGYGTEVNEGEAFKYYLKGAEDGYVRAMYYAALSYYYGTGVKENFPEAFRWFNDGANYGHVAATYYKGKMLLEGEGCTQDIAEGVRLLQSAAEEDEANAQYLLGNCYLTGKGVEENADTAMEWFEKAADNGHEKALKITGRRRRR